MGKPTEKTAPPAPFTPEDRRVFAAHEAAAAAAEAFGAPEGQAFNWDLLGAKDRVHRGQAAGRAGGALARFVRGGGTPLGEALYRHGSAQGVHDGDPDGWAALPFWTRAAWCTFGAVLTHLDDMAEQAAEEARRPAPDAPPPLAAALALPEEETTLARQPDPLATRPGMALRRDDAPDDGA